MNNLPSRLYQYFEDPKNRKTTIGISVVLVVVMFVAGLLIGNINPFNLNWREKNNVTQNTQETKKISSAPVTLQGTVTYLGDNIYSEEGIMYSLVDSAGNDIVLLRASDEKLSIVSGLFVKVVGPKGMTKDEKSEVLNVSEVIINNGSN